MVQDERSRSRERIRILAESVFLQIDEDRLDALAEAFNAALVLVDGIDDLARSVDMSVAEPYEAAWQGGRAK